MSLNLKRKRHKNKVNKKISGLVDNTNVFSSSQHVYQMEILFYLKIFNYVEHRKFEVSTHKIRNKF